ncbi:MAG: LamG-like jellyroll fold domain-containing protein, partial [Paracraurococcus sp.]
MSQDLRGGFGTLAGLRHRWRRRAAVGSRRSAPTAFLFEALEPRVLLSAELDLLASSALTTTLEAPKIEVDLGTDSDPGRFDAASAPTGAGLSVASLVVLDSPSDPAPVTGSIDVPGETDRYVFLLTEPKRLVFDSLTNDYSLTWSLSGPRGAEVTDRSFGYSDAFGIGGSPVLGLKAGEYTLSVDQAGDRTGAYAFRLLDLALAQDLAAETPTTATLTPAAETQAFRFSATAGDRLFLDALSRTGGYPQWRLLDPYDRPVFSGAYAISNQEVTAPSTGTYTLLIEGQPGETGTSTASFQLHLGTDGTPEAILPGALVSGRIAGPGDTRSYTLTLAAPARLVMDTLQNAIPSLRWTMTGPRGLEVNSRELPYSDADYFFGQPVLDLPAGTYTLRMDTAGDATGNFAFRLLNLADATSISANAVVTGTLGNAGTETRSFTFDAARGDQVSFDDQGSTGTQYWRLIDPSGRQSFAGYAGDTAVWTVKLGGTQTVLIEGAPYNTSPANFQFRVVNSGNVPQPAFTGTALTFGTDYTGTLPVGGTADFVFTTTGAKRLAFDTLTYYAGVRATLEGPRGVEFQNRFDYSDDLVIDLPVAGAYRLRLAGGEGAQYGVRLVDFDAATPIAYGDTVNDTLVPNSGLRAYSFTAAAGDKVGLDNRTLGVGANWSLWDAHGRQVFNTYAGTDQTTVLQQAGRYTLLVGGYPFNGGSDGAFSFTLGRITDTTAPIAFGQTVTGDITQSGQTQSFTFTLPTARQVWFDSQTYYGSYRWNLTGPRGAEVTGAYFSSDDRSLGKLPPGEYRLTVDRNASPNDTGPFGFRLLDLDAATPVTLGTTVSGTRSPGASAAAYAFVAAAGDRLYFEWLRNDSGYTRWTLLDPSGRQVVSDYPNNAEAPRVLAEAGRYTLIVGGLPYSPADSAEFAFRVVPVVDQTRAVVPPGGAAQAGPLSVPGQLGTALVFTGAERAEVAAGVTDLRSTVTMELWARPERMVREYSPLLFKGDGGTNGNETRQYSLWLRNDGTLVLGTADDDGGEDLFSDPGAVTFGTWSHIAAVMDRPGGVMRLYVNGAEVATAPVRNSLARASTANLRIGSTTETWTYAWTPLEGTIDDVRLWSTVRTPAQIAADMLTPPAPDAAGLVVYLPMDDASGATVLAGAGPGGTGATVISRNAGLPGLITGRIEQPGQVNRLTFALAAPTLLYFDTLTDDSAMTVTLTGPTGQVITRNLRYGDSFELGGTAPAFVAAAGDWTIAVDAATNRTGSYAFRLLDLGTAPSIAYGVPVSGTLNPGNRTDAYRIAATAGDKLLLDVTAFGKPASYASFRLIDPFGRQVGGPDYVQDNAPTVLAFTGTYTLLLEGRIWDPSPSPYAFTPFRIVD